jgi:hypothetical protein
MANEAPQWVQHALDAVVQGKLVFDSRMCWSFQRRGPRRGRPHLQVQ